MLKSVTGQIVSIGIAFGAYKLGKALFVDPIRMAGNFQQTLKVLQAVTHSTGADMQMLSARAIKLGADVKLPATSAQDAADAMLQLGKAGFSTGQIMGSVHDVLLLSAAAEISNADSADMVSKAIGAFGLKAKDTKVVVDDFAGAANQSQSSIQDVGFAMTMAGAAFKSVGVPIGDASTAIALMAKHGITGSMAGSALNQAFLRLGKPTKDMTATMKDLGVNLFDSNGKFVGMRSALEQLHPKLAAMTDQQRLHTLAVLGGSRASKAMQFVLGASTKEWDAMKAAVERSGQAQEIANAKTSGFNGAMSGLRSTIETLQITVGTRLLPVMTQFVRWLTTELPAGVAIATTVIVSIGSAIGALVAAVQPHMAQLRAAFDDVVGAVRQFAAFLSDNVGNVHQFAAAIGIAAGVFVTLTAAAKAYAIVQAAINVLLVANPIGLIIISIAALVAAFVLLYQRSETVRQVTNALWADLQARAQQAIGWIKDTGIPGVIAVFHTLEAALDVLKAHWDQIWSVFGPIVKANVEIVKTVVVAGLKIISDAIQLFVNLLHGRWGDAWGNLKGIASTALGAVVSIVGSMLRGLAGSAGALAQLIGKAIAAGIKSAVQHLEGLAGDLIGRVRGALSEVIGAAITAAESVGRAIASGIVSGVGNLASDLASKLTGAVGSAIGSVRGALHIKSPSGVTADLIGDPMAAGVIEGFVNRIKDLGPKAAKSTLDSLKGSFDNAIDHLKTTLESQLKAAQTQIEAFKAKLTPTEALMAANQAKAALETVKSSYNQAVEILTSLKAKQDATWAQLLADQAKNMAALQKTATASTTDAAIAEHEFMKGVGANAGDPLALQLVQADQNLRIMKDLYNQGSISLDQLLAYQDAYDAASLAAQDDSNATKLDADYNTWQTLAVQAATAQQAITDQQAADLAAQAAMQATFKQEQTDAQTAYGAAKQALLDYYIQQEAAHERAHTDAQAAELNAALVARYNRIDTHLDNVRKNTDASFSELERMASKSGGNITENLAAALRNSMPTLTAALKAISNEIAKYLKTNSPTELGPMSTLDTWWKGFAPALIQGLDRKLITDTISGAVNPRLSMGMMTPYATDKARAMSLNGLGGGQHNEFHFNETPANADPVAIGATVSYALKNLRT